MKYESNILERLIKTYGVVGNPKYVSEIIKQFIIQGKECYPNLFTYQSDWLAHIDEFGLENDYVVTYTGQRFYAPNTKESPVKRAILKGSTKYRDIDTGEVLDAFEDGRNLELVSVRMPVLTTMGENLIDSEIIAGWLNTSNGEINNLTSTTTCATKDLIKVKPATQYSVYKEYDKRVLYAQFNEKQEFINFGTYTHNGFTTDSNAVYVRLFFETPVNEELKVMLYEGGYNSNISYEPYKSNILTVNEDVTLRSNGSVYDELDLLTGKLTQRIDEDGEVLAKEVIKTVDLNIKDQNNQVVNHLTSFEGGTHFDTSSQTGTLIPTLEVDVVVDLEETLMTCSTEGNTM